MLQSRYMSYKGKIKNGVVRSNFYKPKEGYDLYAKYYEKDYGYLNSFEKDVIFIFLGDLKKKKVLDIGCGTGRLIRFMSDRGAEVSACDISDGMLNIVRKKFPKIETVNAEMEELPFKDGIFDIAMASFVIVHLKDLNEAFEEVYRVLKDGGCFVLTNINQRKAPKLKLGNREEIVIESHYHRPEDVIKALEANLFTIEKEEFVYEDSVWINQVIKARK